jgi:hypothetical protein
LDVLRGDALKLYFPNVRSVRLIAHVILAFKTLRESRDPRRGSDGQRRDAPFATFAIDLHERERSRKSAGRHGAMKPVGRVRGRASMMWA